MTDQNTDSDANAEEQSADRPRPSQANAGGPPSGGQTGPPSGGETGGQPSGGQTGPPPSGGMSRAPTVPTPGDGDGRSAERVVYWGALAVFGLVAAIALFNFYTSSSRAISIWVDPRYESMVQAAFSLVVLLAALIAVSLTVRALNRETGEPED